MAPAPSPARPFADAAAWSSVDAAIAYARRNGARFVDELKAFIRFPSVGSEATHANDVRGCARWLAAHLAGMGMDARLIATAGHPLVLAEWRRAAGRPTVLVYGHYDVQPAEAADGWATPPFAPVIRGAALFGRGASDDKGQLWAHVKAAESCLRAAGRLPVNLVFLFEGEEESGSAGLLRYLAEHGRALGASVAVISDMAMRNAATPAITCSMRGALGLEIEVRGPGHDLHSGLYGGAVANPLHAAAEIVARLHEVDGGIAIPGFYEGVAGPSPAERARLRRHAPTDAELLRDAGATLGAGEAGFTAYERTTLRPSVDVHGITGGYAGDGVKGVIPARAAIKLSFRLVAGQDPARVDRLVRAWLATVTPPGVGVRVKTLSAARPVTVDPRHPALRAAAGAARETWGRAPAILRSGGTLPPAAVLAGDLGIPTVLMGFALPDDGMHAPDEKLHLPNLFRGIDASIRFLHAMGRARARAALPPPSNARG